MAPCRACYRLPNDVNRCLPLSRVLSLVGGLALVAAFFMPWFSSQGLLLSGQFLHNFLASPSQADLRRFLPASSPSEVQLLRLLVDLFPACGAIGAIAALIGGVTRAGKTLGDTLLALAGLVPLLAWAVGITRLPSGANPEIGLYLIAAGAAAMVLGLFSDFVSTRVDPGARRSTLA